MLITEELFLLLRRDDGKPESAFTYNVYGLIGALITDLVLAERVTLSEDKDPRVTVLSEQPTGNPVLDAALPRLVKRNGKKLSSHIMDGKLNPETAIGQSLAAAGIVQVEEKQMLGMIPAKYPVLDPTAESRLRERLRAVLTGANPTPADATLLATLLSLDLVPKLFPDETRGMGKKELKARVKQIADCAPAAAAVKRAVDTMNTIIMSSSVAAISASTAATST